MVIFPTQNSVVLPLTMLVSKLSSSSSLPIGGTRAHLKGRSVGASPGLGVSGFLHGCNPDFISCHAQCKDDRIDISTYITRECLPFYKIDTLTKLFTKCSVSLLKSVTVNTQVMSS